MIATFGEGHLPLFGKNEKNAVAGDRTRVARVTGGNTHHYTTTTLFDVVLTTL